MYQKKRELTENNVLSIEEYLNKRKARRDKQETDMPEELIPFEVYLSSSLSCRRAGTGACDGRFPWPPFSAASL